MTLTPAALYREMCDYLVSNGWQREEPGSGWWWHEHEHYNDDMLGNAVELQLHKDGIDMREEPAP